MTDSAPQLRLDVDLDPRVHYALHQNDVPVVKEVRLTNEGDEDLHDLDVAVTIGADLAKPWRKRLDHLRAGATHRLTALDLGLDPEILRNQGEREATSVEVVVTQGSGDGLRRLAELEKPVEILAFREWAGLRSLPELLAAFVLPNQRSVQGVLARTATRLQQATGRSSLAGYQERDPARVRATIAAVFQALHDAQLRYANPPASFEEEGQKVRLPDDVLETRLGTCLDLVLLAAAVLEQIGLHPLLVLVRGHAFVGCWLDERTFAECVVVDGVRLRKRIDVGDVLVFEATRLTEDHPHDFEGAIARGRQHLDDLDAYQCAVDVRQARVQRIRPLPVRGDAGTAVAAEELTADREGPGAEEVPNPAPVVDPDPSPTLPEPAAADLDPGAEPAEPAEPVPAGSPEPDLPTDPKERRIEGWKRRLLDLTYRNRLLAFRETRRSIPLLLRDAAVLEDRLAAGAWFVCRPAPQIERDPQAHQETSGEDLLQAIARDELDRRRLVTPLTDIELDKRLIETWRHARASLEETGANTLFLAVGMLRYREAPQSSVERHAPILLLPVEIERQSVREGFRLRIADDDPQVNVTLLEKLRAEFGIDPTGLDALPEDDDGLDVPAILQNFRRAVVDLDGFEVEPVCHVAIFSFQKFLMWRDLQARSDDLLKNPVVAHLVERSGRGFEPDADYPDPAELDDTRKVVDTLCPMDADSSQLAAVFASSEGRSFVLEGPPGTGKSQTITNLIAQNLAAGRRVLFVSEKRAALEVVRDRLGRIGLGAFCLELHSNKASKKEVLEQLLEAFELAGTREPADWERVARELETERDALNGYVRAIHAPRGFGESLFQVTSQLIGLRDAPRVALEVADVERIDQDAVEARRDALDRLVTAVGEVGTVAGHPFAAVRRTEWRVTLPDELDKALADAQSTLQRWNDAVEAVAERFGVPTDALDKARVHALEEIAALVAAAPGAAPEFYTEPGWTTVREQALAAVEAGRARDELRRHVGRHFELDAVLRLPLDEIRAQARAAQDSFWPLSWWRGRKPAAALKPALARGAALGDMATVVEHLDQAIELRRQSEALADSGHDGARLFGPLWRHGAPEGEAPWDVLAEAVEQAGRLRAVLLRLREGLDDGVGRAVAERVVRLATDERDLLPAGAPVGDELRAVAEARAGADATRGALDRLLILDPSAWEVGEGTWVPGLLAQVAVWQREHRARLRDWLYYRETRDAASALGLETLVQGLEAGDFGRDDVGPAFERSFRESWWTAVVDADPGLRSFVGADHERRIKRFRELDREALGLVERLVMARLAAKVPSFETAAAEASELGILQREARKKRRHLPVRKLFERIPNLIPRVKPCVLMSPLSVAQYLDPAAPPYDLVVFDEASQITVWDSIGALARGAASVVVGDSKQLPPTSFFQKADDDEAPDDLDMEELESILDECTAAGFRSMRLGWHYRSRHESLITFSNWHYYDNRLHTFPSPVEDPAWLGVSWVEVADGVYDRSKSRTNRKEAESVVQDLVMRLRTEVDDRSYGIVTFSRAQQELIEDLLDQARREDSSLEPWFTTVEEPVFVKNLENVQGDERDVILFSVCYGPDEAGKLAMNFGPLNMSGGERRLNVAVTRARRQVIVHSTLTADRIDLSRTNATGVHHLKTFHDYAARGPVALAEAVELQGDASYDSPFEQAVAERLRARGHDVELQVGCSGYRIDLAIRDPERPGRFLLGIECDGAFYHSAKSARDRDRIRQAVLEGLGWQLCRIWSTDWWRSPERELERVEEALEAARREAAARAERQARRAEAQAAELARQTDEAVAPEPLEGDPNPPEPVADDEPGDGTALAGTEQYRGADTPVAPPPSPASEATAAKGSDELAYQAVVVVPEGRSTNDLYQPAAVATIHALAREVLGLEAPIHRTLFQRRLAGAFEARLSSKVRARLDALVAGLPRSEQPVPHGEFLWRADQDPDCWSTWRSPGTGPDAQRDAEEIPPQEVAACAAEILAAQIALPRDDLARECARRLGFGRMGTRVESAMAAGLALLIDRGAARPDGDNLVTPG